jgi:acetyl esterase
MDSQLSDLAAHYPTLGAVDVAELTISGRHGDLDARRYSSSQLLDDAGLRPGLVWFHGGGFLGGDLDMACAKWVAADLASHGCVVISGTYTMCIDGVHYPTPNDDVMDVWRHVVANSTELGIDPSNIHLGGASAGATLVASVAKRLRDGEGVAPRSVLLVYPALHQDLPVLSKELAEAVEATSGFVITPEMWRSIADNYTGNTELGDDPYAFAAEGDLAGLAPTYILNSEIDPLRASGEIYGEALKRAGVDVAVDFEPESLHGHLNEPFALPGERSLEKLAAWLERFR